MPTDTSTAGAGVGYSRCMNRFYPVPVAALLVAASLLCPTTVAGARPAKNLPLTDAAAAQQVMEAELRRGRGRRSPPPQPGRTTVTTPRQRSLSTSQGSSRPWLRFQ